MWNDPAQLATLFRVATLGGAVLAFLAGGAGIVAYVANRRIDTLSALAKRTPPAVDASIAYGDDGNLYVVIDASNDVPFDYDVRLIGAKNQILTGIRLERGKVYPTGERRQFIEQHDVPFEKLDAGVVRLWFNYRSLYAAEVGDTRLAGTLEKRYRLDPVKRTVIEIK